MPESDRRSSEIDVVPADEGGAVGFEPVHGFALDLADELFAEVERKPSMFQIDLDHSESQRLRNVEGVVDGAVQAIEFFEKADLVLQVNVKRFCSHFVEEFHLASGVPVSVQRFVAEKRAFAKRITAGPNHLPGFSGGL